MAKPRLRRACEEVGVEWWESPACLLPGWPWALTIKPSPPGCSCSVYEEAAKCLPFRVVSRMTIPGVQGELNRWQGHVAVVLKACLQKGAGCGLSPDPPLLDRVVSPQTKFSSAKKEGAHDSTAPQCFKVSPS